MQSLVPKKICCQKDGLFVDPGAALCAKRTRNLDNPLIALIPKLDGYYPIPNRLTCGRLVET